MTTQLEAVFEKGVFRPLQPLDLPEHQQVTLTIETANDPDRAEFVLSAERGQEFCAALDAPPRDIPALRKLLTEPGLFDGRGKPTH